MTYLSLSGLVAAIALRAIFGASPDSWFHADKNHSFALLFLALGVLGVPDLMNGAKYGKVRVKLTPLCRHEHPRVPGTPRPRRSEGCF